MVERNRGGERDTSTNAPRGGQPQATTPGAMAHEQVTQVKEQVQQTAADLKGQVTEQATGKLEEQKAAASGSLNTFAHAVRQTADQLEENDQTDLARYIHRAAGQVENLANYIGQRDLRGLAQDTEQFARREPALFLGGAFTLGLFAARFLKSSGSGGGAASGQSMPGGSGATLTLPATSSYQPPVTPAKPPITPPPASPSAAQPPITPTPVSPATRPSGLAGAPPTGGAPAPKDAIVGGPPISPDVIVGGPPREPGKEPRR